MPLRGERIETDVDTPIVAGCDDPRFFGGAKWRRGGDQGARDGPLVGSMVFDQKGRSSSSMWMRLLGLA